MLLSQNQIALAEWSSDTSSACGVVGREIESYRGILGRQIFNLKHKKVYTVLIFFP
jgi:hypothetical protein